jgi:hypothetical protein
MGGSMMQKVRKLRVVVALLMVVGIMLLSVVVGWDPPIAVTNGYVWGG